jgi:diguanylate cyclase (GGDEF)-like protein
MLTTPEKTVAPQKGLWALMHSGSLPTDNDQERLKKAILSLIASGIAVLAIFWGLLYVVSGYPFSGSIPLTYAVISFFSIAHFFATKKFSFFRSSQFMMILLLPFFLMWSLGGFANGSSVMIWAFFTPLAALFFADVQSAQRWLIAFMGLTVFSAAIDSTIVQYAAPMSETLNTVYFLMNMGCGFLLIYIVLHYFVRDREAANLRAIAAREEALEAKGELEQAYQQVRDNEAKIMELMLTDSLTGVANRRALNDELEKEVERAKRYNKSLGVIMADLDFFKSINDSYGHTAGDEVLKAFARIMRETVRSTDFIARYGGEEFVIIMPEITSEGLYEMTGRIRETLEAAAITGLDKPVTASFGASLLQSGDDKNTILSRADEALYKSKAQGRNCITLAA